MRVRIYWRAHEIEALATRMLELGLKEDDKDFIPNFRIHQPSVLEPDRIRDVTKLLDIQDVVIRMKELRYIRSLESTIEILRRQMLDLTQERDAVQALPTVKDFTFDEIVKGVITKVSTVALDSIREEMTGMVKHALASSIPLPSTPSVQTYEFPGNIGQMPSGAHPPRIPRIVVVGLLNQQANDVEREFPEDVEFRFVKAQGGHGMVEAATSADAVFAMTKFIGHDVEHHSKDLKCPYIRVNGSVSALKKGIRKYLSEGVTLKSFAELNRNG